MLPVRTHTDRHGDRPAVLTDIDKYTHLASIYADELKCTYLSDRTACTPGKGILVQFRCNTGIILIAEV